MINSHKFETNQEWLDFRKQGVGGSEAAVLFDESPYTTLTALQQYKLSEVENSTNPILTFGNRMENVIFNDFVLRDFPDATPYDNTCFVNDKYPRLQASPDGIAGDTVIEIKFVNLYGGAKWKGSTGEYELPRHYWHQVQHYMTVLEKKKAVVYALIQEIDDVIKFEVEWNEEYAYQLHIKATDFITELSTVSVTPNEEFLVGEIPEKDLLEYNNISNDINTLNMKKKAITDRILSKYPAGTKLYFKHLKGSVYNRGDKTYFKIS